MNKLITFVFVMLTTSASLASAEAPETAKSCEYACLFCCNNSCNGSGALA